MRYEDQISTLYRDAVKALKKLLAAENTDSAQRVFDEAISESLHNLYLARNNYRESRGHTCIEKLTRGKCSGFNCRAPGSDHCNLMLRDGKVVAYTSQPYVLHLSNLREIVHFADEYNLDVTITAEGWHFASKSLLLSYLRRDES